MLSIGMIHILQLILQIRFVIRIIAQPSGRRAARNGAEGARLSQSLIDNGKPDPRSRASLELARVPARMPGDPPAWQAAGLRTFRRRRPQARCRTKASIGALLWVISSLSASQAAPMRVAAKGKFRRLVSDCKVSRQALSAGIVAGWFMVFTSPVSVLRTFHWLTGFAPTTQFGSLAQRVGRLRGKNL